jgi:hypothetical protein
MTQANDHHLKIPATDRAALGSLRSVHPAASGMHKFNMAVAATLAILPGAAGIYFLVEGYRVSPGKGIEIAGWIFGGLALAPAVGFLFLVRKLGWRLYLYQNGFVWSRMTDRVVQWSDVTYFFEQQDKVAGMNADRWLRFLLVDGSRPTIDSSYQDFGTFADAVRVGVKKAVLACFAALPAGQALAFGKLLVSETELENEGRVLPWTEVQSVSLEPYELGYGVIIYLRDPKWKGGRFPWYTRPVTRFPNVDAFLLLAGQFTTLRLPDQKG